MEQERTFEGWAVLELMGHRKVAGQVTPVEIAGAGFLRIDIPCEPPATQFYAPASVYCLTPTTEALARELARNLSPAPVALYELPSAGEDLW
jgi:hypothetical protein